jgi:hypothetical protein
MTTRRKREGGSSLTVREDQPLIGGVLPDDGQEVTRYFASEESVEAAVSAQAAADARALAGAWSDLDWDEAIEALDPIRHESVPTPPIDEL